VLLATLARKLSDDIVSADEPNSRDASMMRPDSGWTDRPMRVLAKTTIGRLVRFSGGFSRPGCLRFIARAGSFARYFAFD
jgi:hypothetical protein